MPDEMELSDEERALLAAEDASEPEDAPEAVEAEVEKEAEKPKRGRGKRADQPVDTEPEEAESTTTTGPPPGHPYASPAQMNYGDPWGLTPVQMRHDADGNPVR